MQLTEMTIDLDTLDSNEDQVEASTAHLTLDQHAQLAGRESYQAVVESLGYKSFDDIWAKSRPYVRAVVNRFTRTKARSADREDLESGILLKGMVGLCRFEGKSQVTSWFHTIAFNYCDSYYKKSATRLEMVESELAGDSGGESESGSIFAEALTTDDGSYDPVRRIAAARMLERVLPGVNITRRSQKKSGDVGILLGFGLDALAELLSVESTFLVSCKAQDIAAAMAVDADHVLTPREMESLVKVLGGHDAHVTLSRDQLLAAFRSHGVCVSVTHAQIAALTGRDSNNLRCQKSRSWKGVKEHVFRDDPESLARIDGELEDA